MRTDKKFNKRKVREKKRFFERKCRLLQRTVGAENGTPQVRMAAAIVAATKESVFPMPLRAL
jgi:hypothetical protein